MNRALLLCCVSLVACPSNDDDTEDDDKPEPTDGTPDDTDEPLPSTIDGNWAGACQGDVTITYTTSSTTYSYPQTLDLVGELELTEDPPGTVTGLFPFTVSYPTTTSSTTTITTGQGVFVLEGSIDGNDVFLDFIRYTSTESSTTTYGIPLSFELVLSGDTLDGSIVFADPYGGDHPVPCTFMRVAGPT